MPDHGIRSGSALTWLSSAWNLKQGLLEALGCSSTGRGIAKQTFTAFTGDALMAPTTQLYPPRSTRTSSSIASNTLLSDTAACCVQMGDC